MVKIIRTGMLGGLAGIFLSLGATMGNLTGKAEETFIQKIDQLSEGDYNNARDFLIDKHLTKVGIYGLGGAFAFAAYASARKEE